MHACGTQTVRRDRHSSLPLHISTLLLRYRLVCYVALFCLLVLPLFQCMYNPTLHLTAGVRLPRRLASQALEQCGSPPPQVNFAVIPLRTNYWNTCASPNLAASVAFLINQLPTQDYAHFRRKLLRANGAGQGQPKPRLELDSREAEIRDRRDLGKRCADEDATEHLRFRKRRAWRRRQTE